MLLKIRTIKLFGTEIQMKLNIRTRLSDLFVTIKKLKYVVLEVHMVKMKINENILQYNYKIMESKSENSAQNCTIGSSKENIKLKQKLR